MNINGSLRFDASGLSQIENLRVEKVAALPTFGSGDVGRLVYVTGTQTMWLGGATAWISLATGGNAAALQSEVDAIETFLGPFINSDGTVNTTVVEQFAAVYPSFDGQMTISAMIAQLASDASQLTDTVEQNRLTAEDAITELEGDVAAEEAARIAGDAANATAISNEASARAAAVTGVTNSLNAEIARATAAEGVLTQDLADEVTRATTAEADLQGQIDIEEAARIAGDATNATAITAETTRATGREDAIEDALEAEVTRATAAETANATAISNEVTRATAAETTLTTNLAAEVSRATSRENALEADFNARLQGISWKNPVRVATVGNIDLASAAAGYDGVTLANGDRILVRSQTDPAENGIYVFNGAGSALTRSPDMDTAAEFAAASVYVREGSTMGDLGFTNTADVAAIGTDPVTFVQFAGAGSVTAGDGLTQVGNLINVVAADSSITVTADAIQVSTALQTAISSNTTAIGAETTRATAAEAALQAAIAQEATDRAAADTAETAARIADVDAEEARAIAAEGVLTQDLADEVTRATAAEGELAGDIAAETARATAAETANATAISNEVARATAAEGTLTTNLAAEVTRATAAENALDGRVDAVEDMLDSLYFLYDGASSASHTVTHNLGQKYCNVTVVDGTDNVVIPESVVFNTANQLTVTFNTAIACKVVVMGLASA